MEIIIYSVLFIVKLSDHYIINDGTAILLHFTFTLQEHSRAKAEDDATSARSKQYADVRRANVHHAL